MIVENKNDARYTALSPMPGTVDDGVGNSSIAIS